MGVPSGTHPSTTLGTKFSLGTEVDKCLVGEVRLMPSAVAKGSYWKARTKRWLERQGYRVGFLERMLHIQGKHGLIPVKRDQFGADLLAVRRARIVVRQLKGGHCRPTPLAAARAGCRR